MNPPAPVMLIFSFFSGQYAAEPARQSAAPPAPPPGPPGARGRTLEGVLGELGDLLLGVGEALGAAAPHGCLGVWVSGVWSALSAGGGLPPPLPRLLFCRLKKDLSCFSGLKRAPTFKWAHEGSRRLRVGQRVGPLSWWRLTPPAPLPASPVG